MSVSDLFWPDDPLPITGVAVSKFDSDQDYDSWLNRYNEPSGQTPERDRCEQCWREAYGSFPGHVFCREHFMEFQARAIAQVAARRKQGAA